MVKPTQMNGRKDEQSSPESSFQSSGTNPTSSDNGQSALELAIAGYLSVNNLSASLPEKSKPLNVEKSPNKLNDICVCDMSIRNLLLGTLVDPSAFTTVCCEATESEDRSTTPTPISETGLHATPKRRSIVAICRRRLDCQQGRCSRKRYLRRLERQSKLKKKREASEQQLASCSSHGSDSENKCDCA